MREVLLICYNSIYFLNFSGWKCNAKTRTMECKVTALLLKLGTRPYKMISSSKQQRKALSKCNSLHLA